MKIYFVLPCYNEAKALPILMDKIRQACESRGTAYHIIAINDGSCDETSRILSSYAGKIPLSVITHKINRGLGETVRDGFELAAEISSPEDVIIRMDGDNTHEPEYFVPMLEKIDQGYDVVIASRFQPGGGMRGVSRYRTFISLCANMFMKILPVSDSTVESASVPGWHIPTIRGTRRISGPTRFGSSPWRQWIRPFSTISFFRNRRPPGRYTTFSEK